MTPDEHLNQVLSSYIGKADEKSAWMAPFTAEQLRKWREEDEANGCEWHTDWPGPTRSWACQLRDERAGIIWDKGAAK